MRVASIHCPDTAYPCESGSTDAHGKSIISMEIDGVWPCSIQVQDRLGMNNQVIIVGIGSVRQVAYVA